MNINTQDAIILAYGSGILKKHAKESILYEQLLNQDLKMPSYFKLKEINNIEEIIKKTNYINFDIKTDNIYVIFHFKNNMGATLDLICDKSNNNILYIKKTYIGLSDDSLEKRLHTLLNIFIQEKILYFKTNFNDEEILIK